MSMVWPTLGSRTAKDQNSPYSTAERRVPELIPVFGSQPAGDVSHKPLCYGFSIKYIHSCNHYVLDFVVHCFSLCMPPAYHSQ